MKTHPAGIQRFLPLGVVALVAFAGIALIFYLKQTPPGPASAPDSTRETKIPSKKESTPPPSLIPEPATPAKDPGPPEKIPGRVLKERRGEQARRWWLAWKKAYPRELEKNLEKLSRNLQLSPAQRTSIRAIFQREESLWAEYLDRKLEPVFEKGEKPDFKILMSQEYKTLVDRISSDTDHQVHAILTRKQQEGFSVWRTSYNQDRYSWSEGNRDD